MILFETRVAVPKNIIYQICMDMKDKVLNDLVQNSEFAAPDIMMIQTRMETVAAAIANSNEKSCEGWSLEKHQAEMCAAAIRNGQKILAIKEFRAATGAGLREAKLLMDKFEMNEIGAIEFMAVFV